MFQGVPESLVKYDDVFWEGFESLFNMHLFNTTCGATKEHLCLNVSTGGQYDNDSDKSQAYDYLTKRMKAIQNLIIIPYNCLILPYRAL